MPCHCWQAQLRRTHCHVSVSARQPRIATSARRRIKAGPSQSVLASARCHEAHRRFSTWPHQSITTSILHYVSTSPSFATSAHCCISAQPHQHNATSPSGRNTALPHHRIATSAHCHVDALPRQHITTSAGTTPTGSRYCCCWLRLQHCHFQSVNT